MKSVRAMSAQAHTRDPIFDRRLNPVLSQLLSGQERIDEISIRDFVTGSKNYQALNRSNNNANANKENKQYVCAECGKAFRKSSTLTQHLVIHTDKRPFSCETCKKSFNRLSTLISHRKTHAEKQYCCMVCPKSFHQKINLRNHLYVHTELKPFRCSIGNCKKGFNQQSNLVDHQRKKHNCIMEERLNWKCSRCEAAFPLRKLLRIHQFEMHKQPPSIPDAQISVSASKPNLKTGILVKRVDTDAMRTARQRNEVTFGVLHMLGATPVLVRISEHGAEKSLLRPAEQSDFDAMKALQKAETADQVKIAIVATITQLPASGSNTSRFAVTPPNMSYKVGVPTKVEPGKEKTKEPKPKMGPLQQPNIILKKVYNQPPKLPKTPATNFGKLNERSEKRQTILMSPKKLITKQVIKEETKKLKKITQHEDAVRQLMSLAPKPPKIPSDPFECGSSRCISDSLWSFAESLELPPSPFGDLVGVKPEPINSEEILASIAQMERDGGILPDLKDITDMLEDSGIELNDYDRSLLEF